MGARRSSITVLALVVLATMVSAFATVPVLAQEDAAQPEIAGVTFSVAIVNVTGETVEVVEPDEEGTLLVTLTPANVNGTANLTVTASTLGNAFSLTGATTETVQFTNETTDEVVLEFPWIAAASDAAAGGFRVSVESADPAEAGAITVPLAVVPAAAEPPVFPGEPDGYGLPIVLFAAVGGAVLGAVGGFATGKRRRPAPRPRSATLQRMELEKKAERAKTAEEKEQVQEQIKEREKQQSLNRDIQILEAKRKDAERMIDLIKKRHEAGQITKLQYEKMLEKKMGEVDRINEEIAELESERLQQ